MFWISLVVGHHITVSEVFRRTRVIFDDHIHVLDYIRFFFLSDQQIFATTRVYTHPTRHTVRSTSTSATKEPSKTAFPLTMTSILGPPNATFRYDRSKLCDMIRKKPTPVSSREPHLTSSAFLPLFVFLPWYSTVSPDQEWQPYRRLESSCPKPEGWQLHPLGVAGK